MTDNLKKEFINLLPLDSDYIAIERFINQNYVSKEDVKGLKMKKKNSQTFNPMTQTYYHDQYIQGENHKVDEINQKIEGVLKK